MHTIENSNLPDLSPNERLRMALFSIKTWEGLSESDVLGPIDFFMDTLGHLYLDYFQYHIEEAQSIGKDFNNEIKQCLPLINQYYILQNYRRFRSCEAWDGLWHEVCWSATVIEVFHEMFGFLGFKLNDWMLWEYVNDHPNADIEKDKTFLNMPFKHSWWYKKYDLKGEAELLDK